MKVIKIKQLKQDNYLWGTPFNCVYIDSVPFEDKKMTIFSAVIAAFNEKYNQRFKIVHCNNEGFKIRTGGDIGGFGNYYTGGDIGGFGNYYSIYYDKYEVVDDTLYEFESEQEHITFLRKHKLKRLQGSN